jgi:hypothetical protein
MAPDFAVSPVSNWPGSDQIIVIAKPETVFHLPTIDTGFYNLPRCPVSVIRDNDIFAEHTKEPGLMISKILWPLDFTDSLELNET